MSAVAAPQISPLISRSRRAERNRLARPKVAVDTVIFAIEGGRLKCYLVELRRGTAAGKWAFSGGLVKVGEMLDDAARRELYATTGLRNAKLEYTNIACNLLPRTFTFAQLETLYATVLHRELDRRNFRRRIMAMKLLRKLPRQLRGPHRPAALYTFSLRSLKVIEML